MGMFLNSIVPYEGYKEIVRFGKSVMANMIGAFFGRTYEDGEVL